MNDDEGGGDASSLAETVAKGMLNLERLRSRHLKAARNEPARETAGKCAQNDDGGQSDANDDPGEAGAKRAEPAEQSAFHVMCSSSCCLFGASSALRTN